MNFSQVPQIVSHFGPEIVYIGRAGRGQSGIFGNPVHFNRPCPICKNKHRGAGSTLRCFRIYFRRRIASDTQFREAVLSLTGKQLWCPGCRGHQLCHGQIIRNWFACGCPSKWSD